MKKIVGVRFKRDNKIYRFDASDLLLQKNDKVIVKTEAGLATGTVATDVKTVPVYSLPIALKSVIRKVTEEDLRIIKDNELLEQEARMLDGQFTAVQQAIGTPKKNVAGAAWLKQFVEDAKKSGAVAKLIEKHGVVGRLSVAPLA